jgi:hypothetical protein
MFAVNLLSIMFDVLVVMKVQHNPNIWRKRCRKPKMENEVIVIPLQAYGAQRVLGG